MVSQNPDEAGLLELGVDPGWIDAEERVPKHRHGRLELIDDVIDQNRPALIRHLLGITA